MSLDLSNDYLVIDDLQTVTYKVKTGEGSSGNTYQNPVTVPNAYWEEATVQDWQTAPLTLGQIARVVHLWTNQLSGVVPRQGDLVTDANGLAWVVRRVERLDLDQNGVQRYRCICQGNPT